MHKIVVHEVGYYWDKYPEMHGQQNVKILKFMASLCMSQIRDL